MSLTVHVCIEVRLLHVDNKHLLSKKFALVERAANLLSPWPNGGLSLSSGYIVTSFLLIATTSSKFMPVISTFPLNDTEP